MMNRPSPPNDRIAPMVAVAMTWSVAVRKPPMMTGDRERHLEAARGSAARVRPIPRPASMRSRSTSRSPA